MPATVGVLYLIAVFLRVIGCFFLVSHTIISFYWGSAAYRIALTLSSTFPSSHIYVSYSFVVVCPVIRRIVRV